ncbi:MAG: protein kinase [Planctomycetota bacterium]
MTSRVEPPAAPSAWTTRARAVYDRVRRLDGGERRAALDRECGEDWTLHAEVAALLAHEAHPSLGHAKPSAALVGNGVPTELAPDAIAGFRIRRLIGVGGAGAVYEAEQVSPRRTVALKVFRSPAGDERLRQRIAHEAEVLARLQHPSVAQVHAVHAGSAVHGDVPWIAMELVQGTPIDAWCRARGSTLRERAALLATVADAVGHAHACGVVHRDLKPSNVLVTDAGLPKVVDFGVARTLGEAPAVGTLHTRDGDLVGTLAYMSVEQVEGVAGHVDTRTDVHALGTLGFELLAGRLPRDPQWKSLPEWAEALRAPAPALRDVVEGVPADLSMVIAKALEPDRDRRYATAQAFADDLRRFLASQPVVARAPTKAYLLRSFVRRHRALVGGVLATMVALLGGLVVSVRFALESDAQRRRADREAVDVRREAYRAQVGAASHGLAAGDVFGTRAALDRAPPALRGWEWRHLDANIDRAARVVRFAQPLVRWRAVARRTPRVAGGTADGGAVVLDADSGAVVVRVDGASAVERGVFLADGRHLVVARNDGSLERVDVVTGGSEPLVAAGKYAGECDALDVSRGGRYLVESRRMSDPRVRILDLETKETAFLRGPDDWTWMGIAVDDAGRRVIGAAAHGAILLVQPGADGPAARVVAEHDHVPLGLELDPEGRRVVSWGEDRRAIVADLVAGTRQELFLHQQGVSSAAWSPDGKQVATWSAERILRQFDAADGRLVRAIQAPEVEEYARVRVRESGDVEVVDAHGLHAWPAEADTALDVLRGHRTLAEGNRHPYLYDVAFSPDGRRLATAGWDGTVRIWSVATCRTLAVLEGPGAVKAVAWAPDGRSLVALGRPHHLARYDADTGRRLALVEDGCTRMEGGLAFTPDGSMLLTPDEGRGGVCVRDPVTLEKRPGGVGKGRVAYSLAVRGDRFLAGFGDGGWDLRRILEQVPVATFEPHRRALGAVAISADGSLVAGASDDGLARIAEADSGLTRATLRGHVGRVYAVAFSPDGSRVATGGDDGTIRVHDSATGDELLVLRGHKAYVFALAFSPDGSTIASASGDNTARLWCTVPLRARVARADAARALEASVEALVDDVIHAEATPEAAVAALRARPDLDVPHRAAALDVALRRLSPVVGAPRAN